MPSVDLFARVRPLYSSRPLLLVPLVVMLAIGAIAPAGAQGKDNANPTIPPLVKASVPASTANPSGPFWQDLTPSQKQILRPLASTWDSLSKAHKGKWIVLAQNYPSRAPAEQEKMQGRMAEWAALTPGQRERARLNFAETKKVSPTERAAEWETYQNLSIQEKRQLAAKGNGKPAGAAIAVAPISPGKLTAVPITRHTPPQEGASFPVKPRIHPKTLLPLPPVTAPSPAVRPASAAATAD